jgi:nucleotide-binding universal stress UspA family protein
LICSIGSKKSKATVRFAAQVAQALAAEVTLLGVVEKEHKVDHLDQVLKDTAQQLTEQGVATQVRVEAGKAEEVVLREIQSITYDLVAMGALGERRARHALTESVAMRVIERAPGSVLLVKGDRPTLSRVLICFSGTEHGRLSVWTGAAVACATDAETTILHVVDAIPAMYTGLDRMEETLAEFLQSDTDVANELNWATQVVKAKCKKPEVKIRRGICADELLREAKSGDYDLLVLGSSRSPGGLIRVLMGDLTKEVVTRAQRPVLVVRPRD